MPQVDSNDPTATYRMWVARFDSKFPAGLKVPNPARRMYPRIKNLKERMREWAPYHFLMMVEGLREFRVRDEVLPPGAQTIVGSLAHQALVGQTPEGKMRAWVEGHLEHVPMGEKDNGMKLEELHGEPRYSFERSSSIKELRCDSEKKVFCFVFSQQWSPEQKVFKLYPGGLEPPTSPHT